MALAILIGILSVVRLKCWLIFSTFKLDIHSEGLCYCSQMLSAQIHSGSVNATDTRVNYLANFVYLVFKVVGEICR